MNTTESNFNLEISNSLKDCENKDVIASSSKNILYVDRLCDLVLSSLNRKLANNLARRDRTKAS